VEAPSLISKEEAGYCWILGVAHGVDNALTYKILTYDTQTIIYRSVVRSWNDKQEGANLRVPHNPNLDPAVRLHNDNQNIRPTLVPDSQPQPTSTTVDPHLPIL
jgi:hypothetical protein